MAPKRRLSTTEVNIIRETLVALQTLKDYAPLNPAYNTEALLKLGEAMEAAQEADLRAKRAAAVARDEAQAAEARIFDAVLHVKRQVVAQYGPNSNEVEALGLKKKSDYKRPVRRRATASKPA